MWQDGGSGGEACQPNEEDSAVCLCAAVVWRTLEMLANSRRLPCCRVMWRAPCVCMCPRHCRVCVRRSGNMLVQASNATSSPLRLVSLPITLLPCWMQAHLCSSKCDRAPLNPAHNHKHAWEGLSKSHQCVLADAVPRLGQLNANDLFQRLIGQKSCVCRVCVSRVRLEGDARRVSKSPTQR